MDDYSEFLAKSLVIFLLTLVLVLIAMTIRVVAHDARRRGKSPVLVVLLCLLSFPLGLIVWLIFRPDPLPSQSRRFQLEKPPRAVISPCSRQSFCNGLPRISGTRADAPQSPAPEGPAENSMLTI